MPDSWQRGQSGAKPDGQAMRCDTHSYLLLNIRELYFRTRKRGREDEKGTGNRPQMLSQILARAKESILVVIERLDRKKSVRSCQGSGKRIKKMASSTCCYPWRL
jgi:hypothetical protein